MQVRVIRRSPPVRPDEQSYYLVLLPESKRDKKVVRSIALAHCNLHPHLGSGPKFLGKNAHLYLYVKPDPIIKESEYVAALDLFKEPPMLSAYEIRKQVEIDRIKDDEIQQRIDRKYKRYERLLELVRESESQNVLRRKIKRKVRQQTKNKDKAKNKKRKKIRKISKK